jgi:hypothetical protein
VSEYYPRFFNPQDLGQSLKEVNVDIVRDNQHSVTSRWFHSAKDADLFIWLDSKQNIIKQQLSYYGQVVEWNVVEGLKTGHIIEDEGRVEHMGASEIVHFDQQPQNTSVDQARSLLNHMTALKEQERQILVGNFSSEGRSQQVSAEEFIRRFGPLLEKPQAVPNSRNNRLMTWLRRWFKV